MKKIDTAFSNINLSQFDSTVKKIHGKRFERKSNEEIRLSKPYKIYKFSELTEKVAMLNFYNREYQLFFRGCSVDFKGKIGTKDGTMTSIMPLLYKLEGDDKFEIYELLIKELRSRIIENDIKIPGYRDFKYFDETIISIIQHYGLFKTTFVDLTSSLHVASSFSLANNKNGILYVIGMPYTRDIITYAPGEELTNVKLNSIIPSLAKRPIYQEGYFAGHFPYSDLYNKRRYKIFDLARRLIAKFELINTGSPGFWDCDYRKIQINNSKNSKCGLYPNKGDVFYDTCEDLRDKLLKTYPSYYRLIRATANKKYFK